MFFTISHHRRGQVLLSLHVGFTWNSGLSLIWEPHKELRWVVHEHISEELLSVLQERPGNGGNIPIPAPLSL